MKIIRFGAFENEKPGVLTEEGKRLIETASKYPKTTAVIKHKAESVAKPIPPCFTLSHRVQQKNQSQTTFR